MAKKTISATRSQTTPVVRGRTVAGFPGHSIDQTLDVSGQAPRQAQARLVDPDIARQFDFPTYVHAYSHNNKHAHHALPERPNTSGGPASRNLKFSSSLGRSPGKRETRDDLHLHPLGAHGKESAFYESSLARPLPPSSASTRSLSPASFPVRKSSLTLSRTSDLPASPAIRSATMENQLEIGMALGSPSHPPSQSQTDVFGYPAQFELRQVDSPGQMSPGEPVSDPNAPQKQQKVSKWKLLGGLFGGGKKQSSPAPFYQVQPEGVASTAETDSSQFGSPTDSENPKVRGGGGSNSVKKTKAKPILKRAATASHYAPTDSDSQSGENAHGAGNPQITLDSGPILNVDIPSVQMERYSVMFGSVLKPNTTSSSALLARRQATLDRLKSVNEALQAKERELEEKEKLLRPRRATSPQPNKSPAFSLFPNTPSRTAAREPSPAHEPRYKSPLQRSNTAPGALSPARASFEESLTTNKNQKSKALLPKAPPIAPPQPQSKSSSQRSKPRHQPIVTQFSHERSQLVLTSPGSSTDSDEEDNAAPISLMKPKVYSPAWEMVTRHPNAGADSTSSTESTINSASSTATSVSAASHPDKLDFSQELLPPPPIGRGRAGTQSTISTSSMDIPIAFAQPPHRDRSNTGSASRSNLETIYIHRAGDKDSTSSLQRLTPDGQHPNMSTRHQAQHMTPLEEVSSPFSFVSSGAEEGTKSSEHKSGAYTSEQQRASEDEERLRNAANESIARQISISRQQRQLLVPIKKSSAGPLPTSYPSPMNLVRSPGGDPDISAPLDSNKVTAAMNAEAAPRPLLLRERTISRPRVNIKTDFTGLGERLVDSPVRALTPTLVVVDAPGKPGIRGQVKKGSPIGAARNATLGVAEQSNGNMELQHRRSERGVVERA